MLVSTLQQVFEHFVHLFAGEITGSSDLLAHLSMFYPSKVFPCKVLITSCISWALSLSPHIYNTVL